MDEKKLNNEVVAKNAITDDTEIDVGMIEKSILFDKELHKEQHVWLLKGSIWETYSFSKILDLIHRLQADYSNLKERYVKVLGLNEKVIAEQKAEIQRLTREYERITYNKQEYLEWVDGFLRTHTVMKDRGEDYKMFDREWMCNTFWAKIESSLDYIIDLENQRNELQKQVDELKEENAQLSEMADYDKGHKEGYEHGAKTTAKEILTDAKKWVKEHYKDTVTDSFGERPMLFMEAFGCLLAYLKDKHGVEVE